MSFTKETNLSGVDVVCPKIIQNGLSHLRDKTTDTLTFQRYADDISFTLGIWLAESLPLDAKEIVTPLEPMSANFTDSQNTLLVAVLRSGYPMCRGIQRAFPNSTLALVDIKRDETTAKPNLNYDGLPHSLDQFKQVIIPDPMFATGGSASMTIDMLKARGAKNIHFVSIISAPEGIDRIKREHPDVKLTTCAVDPILNEKKYIMPGLGDFGDRYFGTEPFVVRDTINNKTLTFQNGTLKIE